MGVGVSFKTGEYKWLISELRDRRDAGKLIEALDMIPDVVRELVQEELAGVKARLDELSGSVGDLKGLVERIADSVMELDREYSELNRRLSSVELTMGGLTEALLSRIIVDELESMGYKVRSKRRNYRIKRRI